MLFQLIACLYTCLISLKIFIKHGRTGTIVCWRGRWPMQASVCLLCHYVYNNKAGVLKGNAMICLYLTYVNGYPLNKNTNER